MPTLRGRASKQFFTNATTLMHRDTDWSRHFYFICLMAYQVDTEKPKLDASAFFMCGMHGI
jgi:hypothetical protein